MLRRLPRRPTVLGYYLGIATTLALLGWVDLHNPSRGLLGWISVIAAGLAIALTFVTSARWRSHLTTVIAAAMIGRLVTFLNDGALTAGRFLITALWSTALVGLLAFVTSDADVPVRAKVDGGWDAPA